MPYCLCIPNQFKNDSLSILWKRHIENALEWNLSKSIGTEGREIYIIVQLLGTWNLMQASLKGFLGLLDAFFVEGYEYIAHVGEANRLPSA